MSDLIRIVDLEVWAHVGVPDEERAQAQRLLVSVEMEVGSFAEAARTDDVSLTIDYAVVAERIKGVAAAKPRKLIETLVEELAADLLANFPMERVQIELKKFVLPDARWVSVVVERTS